MTNRLTKVGGYTIIPGTPAIPPRPAYCVSTIQSYSNGTTTTFAPDSGGSFYTEVIDPETGEISYVNPFQAYKPDVITQQDLEAFSDGLGGTTTSSQSAGGLGPGFSFSSIGMFPDYETAYKEVCYPAEPGVPGTPGEVVTYSIVGWNGGARSIDQLVGDGNVSFKIGPNAVGALVGLSRENLGDSFSEPTHAFYVASGVVQIVERGQVVSAVPITPTASTEYIIRRIAGVVTYFVDSWSFRSSTQQPNPVYLDASLYSTGDYVEDPAFNAASVSETGSGAGTITAFEGIGSETATYSNGTGTIIPFIASGIGRTLNIGAGTLPAFKGVGSETGIYAQGAANVPVFTGEGQGGAPQSTVEYGAVVLPAFYGTGVGYTGILGTGASTITPFRGIGAESTYAQGDARIPAFIGGGYGGFEEDNQLYEVGAIFDYMLFVDIAGTQATLFALISDELELGSTQATFILAFDEDVFDILSLGDTLTFSQLVYAAINDELHLSTSTATAAQIAMQYATNIANGAVSTYTNFGFDQFVQTDLGLFGIRQDGIYQMAGNTDDGALIDALIDLGASDFGQQHRKRLEQVYLGLSTDGTVYVKVSTDDGEEYVYRAEEHDNIFRATPGKGLRGREWRVKLEVVDATSMELDGVDFTLNVHARRWTR